ncbi:MAG: cyclase family protein [Anaerolineae bacterium]|nr:cyclase family protein [Candidatus Roseilinea sp.]MDW8451003.1 cyclase family protein [Anaerolineae bacterium]
MLYDITRTLSPRTAVFPGDTPVSIVPTLQMRAGDACNVTAITMSAHAGTHVDAPRHYSDDGAGIDAVPLDALIGPARVVTLDVAGAITVTDLQNAIRNTRYATRDTRLLNAQFSILNFTRLLIHTRASEVSDDVWDDAFAYFDPEAAEWLGANGLRLIGTDAPSVDPAASKDLPAHKAFLKHGVIIVENLCLRGVPDGEYELIALPLKIAGNDAGPARVVLRR